MNPKILAVLVLCGLTLLFGPLFVKVVNENERGIMMRFGEITNGDLEPGLYFTIPMVREPRLFDARVLHIDMRPEEYLTQEKKRLIVDSFVMWKISNPSLYYTSTGGIPEQARRLLSPRINEGLRNKFGERTVYEVIAGERDQLVVDLVKSLNQKAQEELGIEIVDVRVNSIELPPSVVESVYNRMRAERDREAREHRSRGTELGEGIRADADRQRTIIMANAYKKAQEIRGEGDATATKVYADAYSADKEFYAFYRSLNAYMQSFAGGKDVLVLEPESDFFKYMKSSTGK
ncbi:protease subunit HflC [gamma proteobacterium HdN1]|nr:protease subunit HflC [gamma proteobacterium HdN1]